LKILVIEDDKETAKYLVNGLQEHGHAVDHATTGRDGLFLAAGEPYDVMIIDRMLPGLDGVGIVKTIRSAGVTTPVLLLTAMDGIDDRVDGLNAGADDYLVKPFAFSELVARLAALGRRLPGMPAVAMLRVADLELDLLARAVKRAGHIIDLQPREFRLLEFLMRHAGEVLTRTMLLESVWDFHFDPQTNVVDVHISRLRMKVDRGFEHPLIHTIRGSGYAIRAPK
jgi:two-component system, OmpR family, response regulator